MVAYFRGGANPLGGGEMKILLETYDAGWREKTKNPAWVCFVDEKFAVCDGSPEKVLEFLRENGVLEGEK